MKKSFNAQGHGQGDSSRQWKTQVRKGMSGRYVRAAALATLVKEGESRYTFPPLENQKFREKDISRRDQEREEKCSERNCACACYRS